MAIDREKFYSVAEIQKQGLVPTAKTVYKLKTYIKNNQLKALTENKERGRGRRYKIKGLWILDFIFKLESGKL